MSQLIGIRLFNTSASALALMLYYQNPAIININDYGPSPEPVLVINHFSPEMLISVLGADKIKSLQLISVQTHPLPAKATTQQNKTIGKIRSMNTKWPSIEEQLHAEKVTRGSALDKLIRDNQDFHILRPEEARDDAKIPLWLRVYWRKNHPDVQHSTVNPGAGYPDVLYTIYAWMLSHQDLPWGSPTYPMGTKGGTR